LLFSWKAPVNVDMSFAKYFDPGLFCAGAQLVTE
jgi:hypothetical protein